MNASHAKRCGVSHKRDNKTALSHDVDRVLVNLGVHLCKKRAGLAENGLAIGLRVDIRERHVDDLAKSCSGFPLRFGPFV